MVMSDMQIRQGIRDKSLQLFEIPGRERLTAMEGLRGVAVFLVFLQHYCRQSLEIGQISGGTLQFAEVFRNFGNRGVELFFVLSGYLIYGIVLKKKPELLPFMARRAQRLYPAFLVALAIGIALDLFRPVHKIPHGFVDATTYILANIAFLPGLFPIEPLFAVNWSLSYEWWFYALIAGLFTLFHLGRLKQKNRVVLIVLLGLTLVALSIAHVPEIPIRGLCFLAGMLLVEARVADVRPIRQLVAVGGIAAISVVLVIFSVPEWAAATLLAAGYFALCSASIHSHNALSRMLSADWLRALGNISYSFYLIHGFVTVAAVRLLARASMSLDRPNIVFWVTLGPVFLLAFCVGAALFLTVEKPLSLKVRVSRATSASPQTLV
jgi:exopolysaccharide production protein ExoZ